MKWPRQSPDMNPVENLWKIIKKRIRERQAKYPSEMKFFFKRIVGDHSTKSISGTCGNEKKTSC